MPHSDSEPQTGPLLPRQAHGLSVAVGSADPERVRGVEEGFRRYFREVLGEDVEVVAEACPVGEDGGLVPVDDAECADRAFERARALRRLAVEFDFAACPETGLHSVETGEGSRSFVRTWVAICSEHGASLGGSGSVEVPDDLLAGAPEIPLGTRRRGGTLGALTGGTLRPRHVAAEATFNALIAHLRSLAKGPRRS